MTTDKSKRKLVVVVHADVKGYSRTMGKDEDYTVRTLASNRQEMYRLVKFHRGWVAWARISRCDPADAHQLRQQSKTSPFMTRTSRSFAEARF